MTAAVAILISGIVHLDLYFNIGYRFASPDVNFGRSLLLNGFGAAILAVALVARREWFVRAAGIGYAVSTIGVFWYTHAGSTFLGFSHGGPAFDPSPQAQITVIMGIITILALSVTFVPAIDSADTVPMGLAAIGAAAAIAAIAVIGLTLKWQPDNSSSSAAAPAGANTSATPNTSATADSTATAGTKATGATTASTAGGAAGGGAVAIKDFAFAAKIVTVAKGTTVTWTNGDTAKHSVVSTDTSFVSNDLPQGATFQHTFDTVGTFTYICGIHPYMTGTITVTG